MKDSCNGYHNWDLTGGPQWKTTGLRVGGCLQPLNYKPVKVSVGCLMGWAVNKIIWCFAEHKKGWLKSLKVSYFTAWTLFFRWFIYMLTPKVVRNLHFHNEHLRGVAWSCSNYGVSGQQVISTTLLWGQLMKQHHYESKSRQWFTQTGSYQSWPSWLLSAPAKLIPN